MATSIMDQLLKVFLLNERIFRFSLSQHDSNWIIIGSRKDTCGILLRKTLNSKNTYTDKGDIVNK